MSFGGFVNMIFELNSNRLLSQRHSKRMFLHTLNIIYIKHANAPKEMILVINHRRLLFSARLRQSLIAQNKVGTLEIIKMGH